MDDFVVVASSRTPQDWNPPIIVDLGPIQPSKLTYTENLNDYGTLAFSVDPKVLNTTIKTRLRALNTLPMEITVYYGSNVVFRGPVVGYQIQGAQNTLTFRVASLLYYTRYFYLTTAIQFPNVDQFTIAHDLIEHWQNKYYGDFGLDVSGIGTSGITRDIDLASDAMVNVYDMLKDLTKMDNGFDIAVNHSTRAVELSNSQGSDLSSSIHIDRRMVRDAAVNVSVAPGDIVSDVTQFGTSGKYNDTAVSATAENTSSRSLFGRTGMMEVAHEVTDLAALANRAQKVIDDRAEMFFVPGPNMVPTEDVTIESFGVGDTVTYSFDSGLGLYTDARRIVTKRVSVTDDNTVRMAVAFE